MKYGEVRKLVLHKKHDKDLEVKPPPESLELKTETECGKSYEEQILPYVSVDRTQTQSETEFEYEKVELFWPHDFLQVYLTYLKVVKYNTRHNDLETGQI